MSEVIAPPGIELETEVIHDRVAGDTEITGYVVGFVSSKWGAPEQGRDRPKPRWGDITVYLTPSGKYVIVRESFSLRYHAEPTSCRMINDIPPGDVATLADIETAECDHEAACHPCWDCRPPRRDQLRAGDAIRYEFPKVQVMVCDTPAQVITTLTRSRRHSGVHHGEVSEPVRALLSEVARNDPNWDRGERPVVRIS